VADPYSTQPVISLLNQYRLVEAAMPANASGVFTDQIQEVTYYYELLPYELIVHHYLAGTTTELAPDETYAKTEGEAYTTSPSSLVDTAKYELVATPANASGTMDTNPTEVTYYYAIIDAGNVIVHYYIEGTEVSVAPDVTLNSDGTAKVGDPYTTAPANNVPANYTLSSTQPDSSKFTGTYTNGTQEVTYYYVENVPNVVNTVINKTGTARITALDAPVSYTINYSAAVQQYIGDATIQVVDYLPAGIDVGKSSLDGGTYDSASKTITWKIYVPEIDTYANGDKALTLTKNIQVVYLGLTGAEGTIENKAEGKVILYSPAYTSQPKDSTADTEIFMPDYTITKTLKTGQSNIVLPGNTVTYEITVTNTGNVDLSNVVVKDSLDSSWSRTIAVLPHIAPNNTVTYEFTYTVPLAVADNSVIQNVASVTSTELQAPKTAEQDVTVKIPGLDITKTLKAGESSEVMPGHDVIYEITVTNTGDIDLHNVVVTDSLNASWNKTIAVLPFAAPNNTVTYEFTYTVPATALDNSTIRNIASVTSTELQAPKTAKQDVTVKVPKYTITKTLASDQKTPILPGSAVNYTITVTNTGDIDLHNVVVTDSLDSSWVKTISTLPYTAPDNTAQYTFTYVVPANTPESTNIKNIAKVDCDELEPLTAEQNVIVNIGNMTITKTLLQGESSEVIPGQDVTYEITVTNTGEIDLHNVAVTDSLDDSWNQTISLLPKGGEQKYQFTYTVPAAAADNQVISNIATATADEMQSPVTDRQDVTVKIPSYTITKTLATGQSSIVLPGDIVKYEITVTNTGDIDLHSVVVKDSLNPGWSQVIQTLPYEVGNTQVFEFTYTVPNTVANNQVIQNVASVTSTEIPDEQTAEQDVTVKVPSYTITKTLAQGESSKVKPGDIVTYEITVTNTCDVDLHNVQVADGLDSSWRQVIDILPSGEYRTYEFTYTVPAGTADGAVIKNIAGVKCDELNIITAEQDITSVIPKYTIVEKYQAEDGTMLSPDVSTIKKQKDSFTGTVKTISGYTIKGYTIDGSAMKTGTPSIADVEADSNIVYIYQKAEAPIVPVVKEKEEAPVTPVVEQKAAAPIAPVVEEKAEAPLPKTGESDIYVYKILLGGIAAAMVAIAYELMRKNDE